MQTPGTEQVATLSDSTNPHIAQEYSMFKHILVPVDGSTLSLKSLDVASGFAKESGAKITALSVSPAYPMMITGEGYMLDIQSPDDWKKHTVRHAEHIRHGVEKRATECDVVVDFLIVTSEEPYLGIIEAAREQHCDLIIMSSHGRRGLSALLLGSETTKVLTHCKLPVLVCR
jgi:nucleotide-binding universal stress UspA family protein